MCLPDVFFSRSDTLRIFCCNYCQGLYLKNEFYEHLMRLDIRMLHTRGRFLVCNDFAIHFFKAIFHKLEIQA